MPGLANAITEHLSELSFSSSVCVNEMSQDSKSDGTWSFVSWWRTIRRRCHIIFFISICLVCCVGESSHLWSYTLCVALSGPILLHYQFLWNGIGCNSVSKTPNSEHAKWLKETELLVILWDETLQGGGKLLPLISESSKRNCIDGPQWMIHVSSLLSLNPENDSKYFFALCVMAQWENEAAVLKAVVLWVKCWLFFQWNKSRRWQRNGEAVGESPQKSPPSFEPVWHLWDSVYYSWKLLCVYVTINLSLGVERIFWKKNNYYHWSYCGRERLH